MTHQHAPRDYDREIADLTALATALVPSEPQPQLVYPAPSIAESPGIEIITTEPQGDANANTGQDRR